MSTSTTDTTDTTGAAGQQKQDAGAASEPTTQLADAFAEAIAANAAKKVRLAAERAKANDAVTASYRIKKGDPGNKRR